MTNLFKRILAAISKLSKHKQIVLSFRCAVLKHIENCFVWMKEN